MPETGAGWPVTVQCPVRLGALPEFVRHVHILIMVLAAHGCSIFNLDGIALKKISPLVLDHPSLVCASSALTLSPYPSPTDHGKLLPARLTACVILSASASAGYRSRWLLCCARQQGPVPVSGGVRQPVCFGSDVCIPHSTMLCA